MKSAFFSLLAIGALACNFSANAAGVDVPGEASFDGETLYVSTDAAEAIFDLLKGDGEDQRDEIKPNFLKKANGIECNRHMNGSPAECRIKIRKTGVAK